MALTREFLKKLNLEGLTDEIIDNVMKEHGLSIQEEKTKVETLTSQNEELNNQLKSRDTDIENLKKTNKTDELTTQLNELQEKYKTETEELNSKIKQTEYNHLAEKFIGEYKFTSNLAKKAILSEIINKALPIENGEFKGGKEYLEELKKDNADAFVVEETPPPDGKPDTSATNQAFKKPQFTASINANKETNNSNQFMGIL